MSKASLRVETVEQAEAVMRKAVWLAFEASAPMGLGFFHYQAGTQEAEVVSAYTTADLERGAYADYLQGRMVKLNIRRSEPTLLEMAGTPRHAYQSWCGRFPTNAALLSAAAQAAGITAQIVEEEE